jgi:Subtilase family
MSKEILNKYPRVKRIAFAVSLVVGTSMAQPTLPPPPPAPPTASSSANSMSAPLYYLPASALDRLSGNKTPPPPPAPKSPTLASSLFTYSAAALLKSPSSSAPAPAPTPAQIAEARCKALLAKNTPATQLPPNCNYPVSVLTATVGGVPPSPPSPPSQPGPTGIEKRCRDQVAQGIPLSQLPKVCQQFFPPPPSNPSPNSGGPGLPSGQCVDPTVFTHVRLIPCPPAPTPSPSPNPGRTGTPVGQLPSPSPPSVGRSTNAPTPAVPSPQTPPAVSAPIPPLVATTPPALTAPLLPLALPLPPPAPPAPIVRGAASQIPMGGGSAGVSPLTLPPPRAPATAPVPTTDAQEFEPGEVVVFAPFAQSATGALDVIAAAGGSVLTQQSLNELEGLLMRVRANDGDAVRLAQTLRRDLPQATVDLHARLFLFPLSGSSSVTGSPRHYARQMLQLPATPVALLREVRVGVIDSGIERVGALADGIGGEKSFLPNEASPADSVHGTAVAALIAGQDGGTGFAGAAPGAKLYIARAMSTLPDGRNYTNAVSVLQALDWLLSEKVPIVNMSLGGKGDATLAIGVAQAIRKGMIVVAAAGNSGPSAAASFPAALPDVIAVTAVDVESKIYAQANRGDYVMVSAPGVDVWAPARVGGANGSYVSGTSFASAWVSGALAVVAGQSANARPDRVRWTQALCASAKDLGAVGRDREFGCGLLQVADFEAKLK